jgi:tetratricopeptide (TPR) repeat protein
MRGFRRNLAEWTGGKSAPSNSGPWDQKVDDGSGRLASRGRSCSCSERIERLPECANTGTMSVLVLTLALLAGQPSFDHARKLFQGKQFDQAIQELNQLSPKPEVLKLLGLSHQMSGELQEAVRVLEAATKTFPSDAETFFFLGRVYYILDFPDKAEAALRTALTLNPKDPRPHELMGLTLEALVQPEAAEKEYRAAIARSERAEPFRHYGALLLKQGRFKEAEIQLRQALSRDPKDWEACFELAKLYLQIDRATEALDEIRAALAANPKEPTRVYYLKARIHYALGQEEEAREAARQIESK